MISSTNAASSVTTKGNSAYGLYATAGDRRSSTRPHLRPKRIALRPGIEAVGAQADAGGVLTLGGGSISTQARRARPFRIGSGSQANLSGAESRDPRRRGDRALRREGGVITATGPVAINTSGGVLSSAARPGRRLRRRRGRRGFADQPRGGDHYDIRRRRDRALGQRRGVERLRRLDHGDRDAQHHDDERGGGGVALQGERRVHRRDRRAGRSSRRATRSNSSAETTRSRPSTISPSPTRRGDLIFADPSIATVNFNNTIANAGSGALLDATGGSFVTLNANASTLTGTIQTDADFDDRGQPDERIDLDDDRVVDRLELSPSRTASSSSRPPARAAASRP